MKWVQVTIEIDKNQADLASEVLMGLGSSAITYSDGRDEEIFEPPVGETPFWQKTKITALFDSTINTAHVETTLKKVCQINVLDIATLDDRVWEDECKKDFHAMQFGKRIWICPSWEEQSNLPKDSIVIDMDPGLAFGTGTHQTTDLCLQYLDAKPPKGLDVIDYGSGTGVLAIASAKLGASSVVAIDNDPQAVIATKDNAKNNQVDNVIEAIHSDDENKIGQVDLLIANILANPLVELSTHLSSLVKPGGKVVLSGILDEQLAKIDDAYGRYFDALNVVKKDKWLRVDGVKKIQ